MRGCRLEIIEGGNSITMLHIRWSKGEVDIEGTNDDLAGLHRALLAFAATKEPPKIQIGADATIDPAPYEKALKWLTVEKSQSLLTAQALNDALYLSGKAHLIALLAKSIPHSRERSRSSAAYHVLFDHVSHPGEVHELSAAMAFTVRP